MRSGSQAVLRREDCECVRRRNDEIAVHERAVMAWIEASKRLGGAPSEFVEGPIYPDPPASVTACERQCPLALSSLENR